MDIDASFGTAQRAAVTVLVDNRADMIVKSTETIKYYTDEALLAEHGFSALIDLNDGETRILWDAGITATALLENMCRLKIDPTTIDKIALSHGHDDHSAAMTRVLQAMGLRPELRRWEAGVSEQEMIHHAQGRRVPLVTHPAAFRERWGFGEDGTRWGPIPPPPREEWRAAGAEILLSTGPHRLGPGCWTTGEIPRRSFEKSGIPSRSYYRDGDTWIPDLIDEDQAVVINVQNKGLVVVSGCAHSGIVNTVRYAQEISGVERVWAILGGFHLARSTAEEIEQTVEEVGKLGPALVVPSHCTGFQAIREFAEQIPEAFVLGLVGTTYLF